MADPQESVWPLPDDLAYVGVDGHIYVLHADGYTPMRVTWNARDMSYGVWQREDSFDRIRYFWPTWSPQGDKIACLGTYGQGGHEMGAGVYVLDLVHGIETWEVWAGTEIAPIYLNWSPDGQRLSFLLQEIETLSLFIADLSPQGDTVPLLSGMPLFHGFSPNGASLAIHFGGKFNGNPGRRLYLIDLDCPEQRMTLSNRPGQFGTPSWSPDGKYLAFTIANDGEQEICLNEHPLSQPIRLGKFAGDGTMLWSTDGESILVSTLPTGTKKNFQYLWRYPLNGQEPELILKETFVTFGCTASGTIVFLSPEQEDRRLVWKIRNNDGTIRTLATFYPSQPQLFYVHFFHQYAQSHRILSSDGTKLVFSGYVSRKEMEDDYTLPRIFVCDIAQRTPPTPVADGSVACWSPATQTSHAGQTGFRSRR